MTPIDSRERRHPRRGPSFYERALEAADRDVFLDAQDVEGIDDEVALLRMQIRRLLEAQPEDPAALQGGIRLLVQALTARHRLTGREATNVTDAAAALLEHFTQLFAPVVGQGEDRRG